MQLLLTNAQLQLQLQLQQQQQQQQTMHQSAAPSSGTILHGLHSPPSAAESSFGSTGDSSAGSAAASPLALDEMSVSGASDVASRSAASTSVPASGPAEKVVTPPPAVEPVKKTSLKRSFQAIKQEDLETSMSLAGNSSNVAEGLQAALPITIKESNSDVESNEQHKSTGGHNAVEQKYRRGINDSLIMLREIVPALHHLRAPPGVAANKRKISQFSLAAASTPAAPSTLVDGVIPPKKLSKQLILLAATDYIRFLASRRAELEAGFELFKTTLAECVDDANVVVDQFEQRWAPQRAMYEEQRRAINEDRLASKTKSGSGRKKKKLDDGSAAIQAAGTTGREQVKRGTSEETEDEDDEDDSEDDDEMDMQIEGEVVTASALAPKGKARARGKAAATTNKASKAAVAKSKPAAKAAAGPPKALMSVFAGASFAGGAAYDMLYGASGSASGSAPVEAPRAWSQGLVKRSNALLSRQGADSATPPLHASQTFFLERPALLTGLVTLTLSCLVGYLCFYLLPTLLNKLTGSRGDQHKQAARKELVRAARKSSTQVNNASIVALLTLAELPTSRFGQILHLPQAAMAFLLNYVFGSVGTSRETTPWARERCAVMLRLLESAESLTDLQALSVFFALFNLIRSPAYEISADLCVKAEAMLALKSPAVLGQYGARISLQSWSTAQLLAKKHDDEVMPFVAYALRSTLAEARQTLVKVSGSTILSMTEAKCQDMLLTAWQTVFEHVMSTTIGESSEGTGLIAPKMRDAFAQDRSLPQDALAMADEVLAALPPSSALVGLAVLIKGVQALLRNDPISALRAGVSIPAASANMSSYRLYASLLTGDTGVVLPDTIAHPVDTLAAATLGWITVRQAAGSARHNVAGDDCTKHDPALYEQTLQMRRLLASSPFTHADEAFLYAQDSLVEALVSIGRKATGLDSMSDSGAEL